jgi:hypothetical protein
MRTGRRTGFEFSMGGRAFVFRFLGQRTELPVIFAADIPRYTLRLALDGGKVAGLAFLLGAWREAGHLRMGQMGGWYSRACMYMYPAGVAIYFASAGGIQHGWWADG